MMELDDAACGPLVRELYDATADAVAARDKIACAIQNLDAAIIDADERYRTAIAQSRGLRTRDVVVASAEWYGVRLAKKYFT